MKIAFVSSDFIEPRSASFSIPIWICEVASRLARNHDVVVYSPKGDNQQEVEYFRGVKYRHVSRGFDTWLDYMAYGASKRFPKFFYNLRKRPYYASFLYDLTYILRVSKDLKTENCDIVHIHEESEFISIIKAFNPKVRIVLHMHCEWLTQLDHNMIKRRIGRANLILGCSKYITDKIRQSFPSVAEHCQTLYNGVDLANLTNNPEMGKQRPEIKQLLFVSRITPEKGLHVLLEAMKEVVEKDPCVRLEIVGYSYAFPVEINIWLSDDSSVQKLASFYTKGSLKPYMDYLEHKLVSLNISNNVTFRGLIPHEEKVKLYQEAAVFIQPSVWSEPFGMGITEAMACQVPVVATKVGGVPEIVEDGKTGLLVEPWDSHGLANAILELLSDEGLRKKMGKLGRKRAESFSWDKVTTNLLSLYFNTLNHVDTGHAKVSAYARQKSLKKFLFSFISLRDSSNS